MPVLAEPALENPYWEAARNEKLLVQRCGSCGTWQWGPEWLCHRCLSFQMQWAEVSPRGRIYSWERVWHPVHPALKGNTPYIAVLVELPDAGGVRMIGNLLGDPKQTVLVGGAVEAVFEHHETAAQHFTLVHWHLIDDRPK